MYLGEIANFCNTALFSTQLVLIFGLSNSFKSISKIENEVFQVISLLLQLHKIIIKYNTYNIGIKGPCKKIGYMPKCLAKN